MLEGEAASLADLESTADTKSNSNFFLNWIKNKKKASQRANMAKKRALARKRAEERRRAALRRR